MITRFNKLLMGIAAFAALTMTSCKKDKFDQPPHNTTDPKIANATIAQVRALFVSGNPITITDDLIIGGVVTADDRSGNFYKQFVIQDSTGAIPVLVNKSGLYTDYPIGRKVYVKCKNLVLGQYGKNVQLGGYIDYTGAQPSVGNIPGALADKYIVKGPVVTPLEPKVIHSFAELNLTTDQSILIKLDPVSFQAGADGVPYADVTNGVSLSRNITDCDGNTLAVRTSNFSNFATANTPAASQKVSIVGVYSVFNSTKQLAIRDLSEVQNSTSLCPTVIFSENFETTPGSGIISLPNWTNYATAGTKNWTSTGTTNKNARFSAFSSSVASQQPSNIGWLITPEINLSGYTSLTLSFSRYVAFVAGTIKMEVLYSTNYVNGADPTTATWNLLVDDAPLAPTAFAPTAISISALAGNNVHIAFRYTGGYSPTDATTQYNLDNVKIIGQ
ncbi:MAG: DUF5689 domain-containing protein [Chitinophagales bacterium]|nr:DUF5689 domain-containing protein [Chitinophagales bacterium]